MFEIEIGTQAENEAREKETEGKEKEPLRMFTVKGLTEIFADFNNLLRKFENLDPNTGRISLIERNVHGVLFVYR